jgi:RNA polymerase sigma-70 factor, ECF subfamily
MLGLALPSTNLHASTHAAAEPAALYSPAMSNPAEHPATDSDEALMLAFAAGDMAAFDTLYARHKRGLYAFVARLLIGQGIAVDDVFQDVWLSVSRVRAQYRPSAQFRTWLYQIARNRTIDLLREKRPTLASELQAAEDDADPFEAVPDTLTPTPDMALDRRQKAAAIARALAALPAVQREAFLLREHSELPLEEVARLTGVNVETAKSRLRYAVAKLRAALRGIWP